MTPTESTDSPELTEPAGRQAGLAPVWPADASLLAALAPWMARRRWYPLKGGSSPEPRDLTLIGDRELAPGVRDLLVAVPRAGAPSVLVHVPLVLETGDALARYRVDGEAPGGEGLTVTGPDGAETALIDGPHHPAFWRAWAQAVLEAGTVLDATGARAIGQRAERLRVTTGEQSNTSVVLPSPASDRDAGGPEDAATDGLIVKLLRVLAPGRNPDVEVSVALAGDGWDRVPAPVAWSTFEWHDPATGARSSTDSAVACTFIPRADDGFELFCSLAADDDGPHGPVRVWVPVGTGSVGGPSTGRGRVMPGRTSPGAPRNEDQEPSCRFPPSASRSSSPSTPLTRGTRAPRRSRSPSCRSASPISPSTSRPTRTTTTRAGASICSSVSAVASSTTSWRRTSGATAR